MQVHRGLAGPPRNWLSFPAVFISANLDGSTDIMPWASSPTYNLFSRGSKKCMRVYHHRLQVRQNSRLNTSMSPEDLPT